MLCELVLFTVNLHTMDEKHWYICEGVSREMTREQHGKEQVSRAEFSSTIHICLHRLMKHTFGGAFYSKESMESIQNSIKLWMRKQLLDYIEALTRPQLVDYSEALTKANIKVYCIIEYTVTQWFATRTVRGLNSRPDSVIDMAEVLALDEGFKGIYAERMKMLIKDFISQEYDEEVLKELDYMIKDTELEFRKTLYEALEAFFSVMGVKREKRAGPVLVAIGEAFLGWIVSEIGGRFLTWLKDFNDEENKSKVTKLDEIFEEWDKSFHINTLCTYLENITPASEFLDHPEVHAQICFQRIEAYDKDDKVVFKPKVVSIIENTGVISVQTWESAKLALAVLFRPLLKRFDEMQVVKLIAYKLTSAGVKIRHQGPPSDRHDTSISIRLEEDEVLALYQELKLLRIYGVTMEGPKPLGKKEINN